MTDMKTLFINKNPLTMSNAIFGLMQIGDGLVRVLSLGRLATTWPLDHSRNTARRRIEALKAQSKQQEIQNGQR